MLTGKLPQTSLKIDLNNSFLCLCETKKTLEHKSQNFLHQQYTN